MSDSINYQIAGKVKTLVFQQGPPGFRKVAGNQAVLQWWLAVQVLVYSLYVLYYNMAEMLTFGGLLPVVSHTGGDMY